MQDHTILLTRAIPEAGMKILQKHCKIISNPEDRNMTRDEIFDNIPNADGLLCMLTDIIDREIIEAAPKLKVISNHAVGFNNVSLDDATKRNIAVTNTPDVLTDATADLTWALILAVTRKIIPADTYLREGHFKGWAPMLLRGIGLCGKTLGLIGSGRIGCEVGLRALPFKMNILYTQRQPHSDFEKSSTAEYVSLDDLLKRSDVVSIHVPLTEQTYHMISEKQFSLMKKDAILINTARGQIVDEAALVEALEQGSITGAGLDVYEKEPKVHPGLFDRDDVVLLPHIASATFEARDKMAELAAENLVNVLKGKKPLHCVNPQIYKDS